MPGFYWALFFSNTACNHNDTMMNWLLIGGIFYGAILLFVSLLIIYDTRSTVKALAYLMLIVFLPVAGIVIYFSIGVNYRKRKMYSKKIIQSDRLDQLVQQRLAEHTEQVFSSNHASLQYNHSLMRYLNNESNAVVTDGNKVQLLLNGEQKFPLLFEKLQQASNHIHLEYYIVEDDDTGNAIADILIAKAGAGVTVRFIYDDFGSHAIRRRLVRKMKEGGIQVYPFYKLKFLRMASRMNYRNHRKIVVIDGAVGFVGGINLSNKYVNNKAFHNKIFWRDTHVSIEGTAVHYLQYLFIADWNFCAKESLQPDGNFFPNPRRLHHEANMAIQFAASGPDYDHPTIQNSIMVAIGKARKELLITSPYFIPGEAIMQSLMVAANSGVKIKLLVPGNSDSVLVNAASNSSYAELLEAGVEIYKYRKGFVHAKTLVSDRNMAFVGTANMDHRSFELNFEVNAVIYDEAIAAQLATAFENDLIDAEKLDKKLWLNRPVRVQLFEKTCRLLAPLL